MSQPAFSRRINGELEFTVSQIERLAQVLRVNEAYIYGFTNDRRPRPVEPGQGPLDARYAIRDSNPEPADYSSVSRRERSLSVVPALPAAAERPSTHRAPRVVVPFRRSAS